MMIVDETVLLRYLLDDDKTLSKKARTIIERGDATTYPEILARAIVTLRDVYSIPRSVIAVAVDTLLDDISVTEEQVVRLALRQFGSSTSKLDFIDCLMLARNILYGDEIASFDRQLTKRVIPGA